ncbi:ExbD/TolR family protein [Spirochaetota bacterium]
MKPFRRKAKPTIKMDMAPLLDVMLMLLLFFLLTSSFLNPSIQLKLPNASNRDRVEKRDIVISVDKNEVIYLNRNKVNIEDLSSLVKKELSISKDKRVIFRGDEKIIFKNFIRIMDILKQSGAKEINIAHEKGK